MNDDLHDSSSSRRKRDQSQSASTRHSVTTEPPSEPCDNNSEEENLFDSIDRLLDEREAERLNELRAKEDGPIENIWNRFEETVDLSHDECDEQVSCYAGFIGQDLGTTSKCTKNTDIREEHAIETTSQHLHMSIDGQNEKIQQQPVATRTKQHVITKSCTARFTFQSGVKKPAFQTPKSSKSLNLPHRNSFDTTSTKKLTQRHSFRKSVESKQLSDVRCLDCTPSFLPGRKRTNEGLHRMFPDNLRLSDAKSSSSFAPLKSTMISIDSYKMPPRNGKFGYLITRLRSLRNNDQRLAMRLRSGQFSISKRRRSGEFPKQSEKTAMDVTVSKIGVLGDRSIVVGYIHRYEGVNGNSVGNIDKLKLPCFADMLLSNDVVREQGITDDTKILRFYDAVVIPKRGSRVMQMDQMDAMPTVICGNVCEQYSDEVTLPNVSFDRFKSLS